MIVRNLSLMRCGKYYFPSHESRLRETLRELLREQDYRAMLSRRTRETSREQDYRAPNVGTARLSIPIGTLHEQATL